MPGVLKLVAAVTAGVAGVKVVKRLITKVDYLPRSRARRLADGLQCGPSEISVLSCNVLSDNFVSRKRYSFVPMRYLVWEYRILQLKEIISTAQADVVCLQEVEVSSGSEDTAIEHVANRQDSKQQDYEDFMSQLGYACIIQDRSKMGGKQSIANATFFKVDKLRHVWTDDRTRVLLTAFTLKDGGAEVCVVNCHLQGNPYKPQERLNQMKSALNRLKSRHEQLSMKPEEAHIIILGDFNATRKEGLYRFLYRGRLEGGYAEPYLPQQILVEDTVSHPYALTDVYDSCAPFKMPYTRSVPGNACTIDYIWISKSLRAVEVLQPAKPSQMLRMQWTGLPNAKFPSDHLPLGAIVEMRAPTATDTLAQ